MNQDELSLRLPVGCSLNHQVLLVSPADFYRLGGILIDHSRIFLMVSEGCLDVRVNGKTYSLNKPVFLDLLDTVTLEIGTVRTDLKAWLLLSTFDFASASLKNLRPSPKMHPLERMNKPIYGFTERSVRLIVQQLQLLKEILADTSHCYRQELAELYFKSFNLEMGNALFSCQAQNMVESKYIGRSDFVTLNFFKLVSQYFAEHHHVDFYANELCITSKHLSRIIKDVAGKTPYNVICDEIIHHALAFLEDDKISVGQIAEQLHFSDQAAFCKFFKKQMNMSPMTYRRKKMVE